MMLNLFRNIKLVKCTSVYISDKHKHLIIAPRYEDNSGVLYEQDNCFTSDHPIDNNVFGEEIINSLNLYSLRKDDLGSKKLSDWPAYKHSKCKTIVSFEKEYIPIFIRSANNSNLVLTLEGLPFKNAVLNVSSSISFYADKHEIGRLVNDIYKACLTGKIF